VLQINAKLCTDIKIEILRYNEEVVRVKIDALYNGKVPLWSPPVLVIRRWIEICMTQKWAHPNSGKTFCMSPLDLTGEEILDDIL
jgi:hypothetical protein